MHREHEYKYLADNARKRGGEEQNAQFGAQWEILAATYVRLAGQPKKFDDTGQITIRWIVREPCGPSFNLRPHLRGLNLLRVNT